MTGGSEGSIGLLVAQPSSLFAYPASQPNDTRTNRSTKAYEATKLESSTYVPDTTNADRYADDHASASRLRLRSSYGTIEWMMRMEFAPLYMTLGIGISSQLLSIMP